MPIIEISGQIAAVSIFLFCWLLVVGLGLVCLLMLYSNNGWNDSRIVKALDWWLIIIVVVGCTLLFTGILSLVALAWRQPA